MRRHGAKVAVGQSDIEGNIYKLDKLVQKPRIIDVMGKRIVGVVVNAESNDVPEFISETLKKARKLIPEVKSSTPPPWMTKDWQTKRRKSKAGKA